MNTGRGGYTCLCEHRAGWVHVSLNTGQGGYTCLFKLEFLSFMNILPGVGLLDHMVALFYSFP